PVRTAARQLTEGGEKAVDVLSARPPAARRAQPPGPRQVAHDHPAVVETRSLRRGVACRNERDECALLAVAHDLEPLAQRRATERGHLRGALEAPLGCTCERRLQPREAGRGKPARIESSRAFGRHEPAIRLERLLREATRDPDAEFLRVTHVQRSERLRPAEPPLARHRVVIELANLYRYRADGLCAVHAS